MSQREKSSFIAAIAAATADLTPKARIISVFIQEQPHKAVFMTAKELAEACRVSEATVVRFVTQLGYGRYSEFQNALRHYMDSELTLLDRMDLTAGATTGNGRLMQVMREEIDNIKAFFSSIDTTAVEQAVEAMRTADPILVIGARLSYSMSYYMGWALTKIKPDIRILRGSDRTTIDWLTLAAPESLVIIVAMARYPNELIRVGKYARRLKHTVLLIADSETCPLIRFADIALIAPSRHIPVLGSPTHISCLINYLVHEVARRMGNRVKTHQARLEQAYLENDLLF
ncbi:MAG: MurR/RpiR family transcriptional regulator [Desulfosarcinaceae bacterium]|nr:MurR/RpiR family transcriptional regulator [Desulfosarcinaceae bacterium]